MDPSLLVNVINKLPSRGVIVKEVKQSHKIAPPACRNA